MMRNIGHYVIMIFAGLKFSKVLLSAASMLFTIWVYGLMFGLPFAAGFVGLIAIHEFGHILACWHRGLRVSWPAFVPFVGAWVNLKDQPHNAETDAYIGFGGPLIGSLAALALYLFGQRTGELFWLALAYSGFLLNLINLIPVPAMDGGRVLQILTPRIWLVGVPLIFALFFYWPSPMLLIIGLISIPPALQAVRFDPNTPAARAFYSTPMAQQIQYGVAYFALTAFLAIMAFETHRMIGR